MNKLIKKIEDIMVAVTFAEAGEYDEASRLSGDGKPALQAKGQSLDVVNETALDNAGR